jgi:hypothetical protein
LNQLVVTQEHYPKDQRPVLAVFTSKGDWATHYAFPIGRFFSRIFETDRSDQDGQEQEDASRSAIGWFQPFITHQLIYDADKKAQEPGNTTTRNAQTGQHAALEWAEEETRLHRSHENIYRQRKRWDNAVHEPLSYPFDECELRPEGKYVHGNPIMIVSVDKRIMKDHDDFANPIMLNFLREFFEFSRRDVTH